MSSAEHVKEKKKNKLRSRFLLTQRSSLDNASPSPPASGNQSSSGSEESKSSSSGSSRIRKMLFRRSRSEDRMRNIRIKENSASFTPPENRSRFSFITGMTPALEEDSAHANHLIPQSPPPHYEAHSERVGSEAAGRAAGLCSASPPSYYEAMGHVSSSSSESEASRARSYWTDPQGHALYCTCHECQARYLTTDDEEPENTTQDNCADAVFPIETHFLMQEVLADGMALCSVM